MSDNEITTRKRGRPPKKDIVAKTTGNRGVRGRPPGDAAIINEYKARMLASPKSAAVLECIFDAALDPDSKNQAAAWKIITDRIVPASYFELDKGSKGQSKISVTVNAFGGNEVTIQGEEEADDAEFYEE